MESKLFVVKKINTKTGDATEVCNPVIFSEATRILNEKTATTSAEYQFKIEASGTELLCG